MSKKIITGMRIKLKNLRDLPRELEDGISITDEMRLLSNKTVVIKKANVYDNRHKIEGSRYYYSNEMFMLIPDKNLIGGELL